MKSSFVGNMAKDGAIVYSMSNKNTVDSGDYTLIPRKDGADLLPSVRFKESEITGNWAIQNLMQILLSDMSFENCQIYDNYAHQVTHGITLISSELIVKSS